MPTSPAPTVRLVVPADLHYLRTVRLVAAGCGELAGLHAADIDDLRLAVDEATALLLPLATDEVTVAFSPSPGHVRVEVGVATGSVAPDIGAVARRVLDGTVTTWEPAHDDGRTTIHLDKRASS